jgi:hypothetical protein
VLGVEHGTVVALLQLTLCTHTTDKQEGHMSESGQKACNSTHPHVQVPALENWTRVGIAPPN